MFRIRYGPIWQFWGSFVTERKQQSSGVNKRLKGKGENKYISPECAHISALVAPLIWAVEEIHLMSLSALSFYDRDGPQRKIDMEKQNTVPNTFQILDPESQQDVTGREKNKVN